MLAGKTPQPITGDHHGGKGTPGKEVVLPKHRNAHVGVHQSGKYARNRMDPLMCDLVGQYGRILGVGH